MRDRLYCLNLCHISFCYLGLYNFMWAILENTAEPEAKGLAKGVNF